MLLALHISLASAQGEFSLATREVLSEVPEKDHEIILINAASFNEATWAEFLQNVAENYVATAEGKLVAKKSPEARLKVRNPDPERFGNVITWEMTRTRSFPYKFISGRVLTDLGEGMFLLEGERGILQLSAEDQAKHPPGKLFQGWCEVSLRSRQSLNLDGMPELDEGLNTRIYHPAEVREPELIEVSNHLVQGGKIYGLAPAKDKACPICKGMRRYSPNKEIPSETQECGACKGTGKVSVRPLFIVYTGSLN